MRSIDSTWGATHFFPATFAGPGGSITVSQAQEMEAGGWETGGHAYTHENLSSVPPDSVEKQIQMDYDFLKSNGLSHESFAYPYGNYNPTVTTIAQKYFKNIRSTHDFEYLDGINRTDLGYYAVKPGMTLGDVIGRIEKARHDGSPLVIIGFHALLADTEPPLSIYWCRQSVFYGMLTYLKKEEYSVMTLKKAMDILCN
jgi:peptidoglycan/xylan/chitin deacetylase (PgdA/CDA1 family)